MAIDRVDSKPFLHWRGFLPMPVLSPISRLGLTENNLLKLQARKTRVTLSSSHRY
jgi:hypothetical protein